MKKLSLVIVFFLIFSGLCFGQHQNANTRTGAQVDAALEIGLDSDITAIAALTTTAYGRAFLELANEAALQALITSPWADSDIADDITLTNISQVADVSANGVSLVTAANYAAMRGLLDLEAGTDFYSTAAAYSTSEADSAMLTAIAAISWTGDLSGSGTSPSVNEANVNHDSLANFVSNEHLDWTSDQGATNILEANLPDLSATYEPAGITESDVSDLGTTVYLKTAIDSTAEVGAIYGWSANVISLLGAADYAAIKTLLDTDDIQTLTGIAAGTAHLGTFSGTTVSDSTTIKTALQELETAVESVGGGHDPVTIAAGITGLTLSTQELSLHAYVEDVAEFTDPNADRIWFWDDSAGVFTGLSLDTNELEISTTSIGLSNHATARTALGLAIGTNVQAYDADLTTYAGITPAANVQSLLGAADYAAMRTLLDLEAGTDFYSISAADSAFEAADAAIVKSDEAETVTTQWDFSNNAPTVPTEIYGAGWNGDDGVPTKDAVYDKIETLSGDVTAAAAFATDNMLIKSDGTGKGVQVTGIEVDDNDVINPSNTPGSTGYHDSDAEDVNYFGMESGTKAATEADTILQGFTGNALSTFFQHDGGTDTILTTKLIDSSAGIEALYFDAGMNSGTYAAAGPVDMDTSHPDLCYGRIVLSATADKNIEFDLNASPLCGGDADVKRMIYFTNNETDNFDMILDPNGNDFIYIMGTNISVSGGAAEKLYCGDDKSVVLMVGATDASWQAIVLAGACAKTTQQ